MSILDIAAIEARLAAATPGPWVNSDYTTEYGERVENVTARAWDVARCTGGDEPPGKARRDRAKADAELIAHAPTDLAALLAEVKRLRQQQHDRMTRIVRAIDHQEAAVKDGTTTYEHLTPAEAYHEGLCDAYQYARGYR